MPVLYILAGPNGTGKTTFYATACETGLIEKTLPFLNVDIIVKSMGGYTEQNYALAPEIYRSVVKESLNNEQILL